MRLPLTALLALTLLPVAAADAAPKNGRIVYNADRALQSILPDGSDQQVVTDMWDFQRPSPSPDGKRLVVASNNDLVLLSSADGSETGRIGLSGRTWVGDPAWSPRGGEIAFASCEKTEFTDIEDCVKFGVYRVRLDGTHVRRVAEGFDPSWSSDARSLTFMHKVRPHDKDGNECFGVYVARRDGSRLRRVVPRAKKCIGADFLDAAPFFGPRDKRIIFHGRPDLLSVKLDGTGTRRLVHSKRVNSIWATQLSPDGRRIVYGARHSVYVTSATKGGRGRRIAEAPHPNALAWLAAQ